MTRPDEDIPYKVAFFDIDGTLIRGTTWAGILQYPRMNRLKILGLQAATLPRRALLRLYLLGQARFRAGWIRGLAGLLKKWDREEVEKLFDWLANDYLVDHYHQEIIALLKNHQAQGTKIVLISTIFEEAAQKIADRLGAEGVIGTRLAFENNIATGRVRGKVAVGARRINFIRGYLKKHWEDVELVECIAYADSYIDAPMLAVMGAAVAVYPDDDLRAAAREQGWRIYPDDFPF
jgi:HAD superfamily hydrolase (TIGR01490 family)